MRILFIVLFLGMWVGLIFGTEVQNPHGHLRWDCQACHTPTSWKKLRFPFQFDHAETGYALIGNHKNANCLGCHTNLTFKYVGTSCADCHIDVHRGALGFDCQHCHTPNGWTFATNILQIHEDRGFTLSGIHATLDCEACHRGQAETQFVGTSTTCKGCHLVAFETTVNPAHRAANFNLECETCHTPTTITWKATQFQHVPIAILQGAHANLKCNDCHHQQFKGTSQQCNDCHHEKYLASRSPAHATFQFPTDCELCHNQVSWNDAQFDHLQRSGFALDGAHRRATCTSCHQNNQVSGLPRDCYGCHSNNFQNTSDPNHVAGNFSHNCTICHTTEAWQPATFDHNQTNFPLTGAHKSVQCQDCHTNTYTGTPTDCYSCHQDNYHNTSDPNHQAAGFPTTCQDCHNTSRWDQTTWDHDSQYFPIYSGSHKGKWAQCSDCHVTQSNFSVFECINCHEHNQTKMDDKHKDVSGYVYQSSACYNCHPNGREGSGD